MATMTVGTCSLCGGAVTQETVQWVVGAPMPPRCQSCGAKPKNAYGPVIEMDEPDVDFGKFCDAAIDLYIARRRRAKGV